MPREHHHHPYRDIAGNLTAGSTCYCLWPTDSPQDRIAELHERIAELEYDTRRLSMTLADTEATVTGYREALEYIAHFDDANMATARTLHYDMRARARAALGEGGV